jgi:hypothetical protein
MTLSKRAHEAADVISAQYIVADIKEMGNHRELGYRTIDGVLAVGIEVADSNRVNGWATENKIQLWVDVETNWPVLMECESSGEKYMNAGHMTVMDFDWQPDFSPSDFEVEVPEDYLVYGPGRLVQYGPSHAVDGLRNFAGITGRFPKTLEFEALKREVRDEIENRTRSGSISGADADSLTTVLSAGILNFRSIDHPGYYGDNAYYGDSVTPGDSGRVLFRWQAGVIYGDLRFEKVDAERPAEPEGRD